ncbi:LytTR family DNA-binding domain-containing protein [Aquimarina litoralis]|uniref:LytTR family DNA-binding domain-containing protein n=1 Tax=Aquimarina litoralis TaxID=584605 RepID=A0ABN1ILF4_9FLAO
MKTITAIIIEQNTQEAQELKCFIEKQCPDISIRCISNNPKETKRIINNTFYDIIILGLQTGIDYAFEILEELPYAIHEKELLLITTKQERTLKVIADTSINFITRPIDSKNIVDAIEKVKQNLLTQKDFPNIPPNNISIPKPLNLLAIPSSNDIKLLKISDILYLESEGRYTTFHASKNKTVVSSTNIGEYQKKLVNNNFFRIHNSFLVNMDNIVNVQKKDGVYVEMNNRDMIPVAKRKKESLFQFLGIK